MHAARRDLKALSRAKGDRVIVASDGDIATQDKRLGIEVMAMIGCNKVRLYAAVRDTIALAAQFRFKLDAIHRRTPDGVDGIECSVRRSRRCLPAPTSVC
jgi:hypothetical protein